MTSRTCEKQSPSFIFQARKIGRITFLLLLLLRLFVVVIVVGVDGVAAVALFELSYCFDWLLLLLLLELKLL